MASPGNSGSLASSLIIALAINWGLHGMLCLQVYTYYLAFPNDRLQPKLQVYGVLFCEFLQSSIVAHDVVVALASSLGDLEALNSLHTHWFSIPASGGITGGVGQLFFAYRIWRLSHQRMPTITIALLSIASVCSAMVSAAAFFRAKTFPTLLSRDTGFASIAAWNGIGAICDVSIAVSMPYFLMRHGTGLRSTHVVIVRLVRLLIETGGLTAIMSILHLCLYFALNPVFVVAGLAMSKIYAITMLVILNSRLKIEGGRFGQDDSDDLPPRNRENGRGTSIIVSNRRLTFQLADEPVMHDGEPENITEQSLEMDISTGKVDLV